MIDEYVAALDETWQRVTCQRLLLEIRDCAPFDERLKWGNPYFELHGRAVLKWYCAKAWVNVYFFRGRELADPRGHFEPSENVKMLPIKLSDGSSLDYDAFHQLVKAAAELSRML